MSKGQSNGSGRGAGRVGGCLDGPLRPGTCPLGLGAGRLGGPFGGTMELARWSGCAPCLTGWPGYPPRPPKKLIRLKRGNMRRNPCSTIRRFAILRLDKSTANGTGWRRRTRRHACLRRFLKFWRRLKTRSDRRITGGRTLRRVQPGNANQHLRGRLIEQMLHEPKVAQVLLNLLASL